jgi:hypothetical protein
MKAHQATELMGVGHPLSMEIEIVNLEPHGVRGD